MSLDTGITVTGGGTQSVDTAAMQAAAQVLAASVDQLGRLWRRLRSLRDGVSSPTPGADALAAAQDHLSAAMDRANDTTSGLRIAAQRYAVVEETATSMFRDGVALQSGALGTALGELRRSTGIDLDPAAVALIAAEGVAVVATAAITRRVTTPFTLFDPFADAQVVGAEGRGLASVDDLVRGEHGQETVALALGTDRGAAWSTQRIAARGAETLHDEPGFTVTATEPELRETPRGLGLAGPRDLAGVGALVPDDGDGRGQVRVTQVQASDGIRRWIVAVAGTTTFSPSDEDQVFDMRSNLQGVGGVPMDAEETTETSMRMAGVQPGDPVLVVGHSQGALVAMRLAQSRHFDVTDVVTLGGPTRPIAAPPSVHVLAVEHTDDPIPGTGGAAPDGPGPANEVVVRRTVYELTPPVPQGGDTFLAPAHLPSNYVDTLADVDRSPDPRLVVFRARVQPFLSGEAVDTQVYRADRGYPQPPYVPPANAMGAPLPRLVDVIDQNLRAQQVPISAARSGGPTAAAG